MENDSFPLKPFETRIPNIQFISTILIGSYQKAALKLNKVKQNTPTTQPNEKNKNDSENNK